MAQQPDPPGRQSWMSMGFSGREDSRDKGFNIGVCTLSKERGDSDSCMSRGGSNSLYLVGSLSLDDASPASDLARRSAIGSSTNPPREPSDASEGFLRSRSEDQVLSRELPWSSSIGMIPEYQLRNRLGGATEVGQYDERLEGKLDGLRREVRALREQNQQLNSELHRTPAVSYRHSSMPADLASSSSLRSAMIGTLLPAPAAQEDAKKREFMPAWGYDAVDLEATMVLVLTGRSLLRLPPQQLQSMTGAEFRQLLQRYKLLLEESCKTAQTAGMYDQLEREMSGLINEATALTLAIATCNPAVLQGCCSDSGNDCPDWRAVMGLLNLTEEQKQQFTTMKQLYTCASEQLATERAALLTAATEPTGNGASLRATPAVTMQAAALKQVHLQELLEKLKQNASRQNRNLRLLADGALRQVLSPLQAACAFIYSYPSAPDILAMVHTLEPPSPSSAAQPSRWSRDEGAPQHFG